MSEQVPRRAVHGTTFDDLFDVLSGHYRRSALSVLQREDSPMHVADLARELAAADDGRDEHDRLYHALHHTHVPKLVDAGLVAVNDDRVTVEIVGEIPSVEVDGVAVTPRT